ncbi:hypothetical protein [Sediminibacterium sp.]|uniref:hypothetical protein n=1 Tax=Sediminibacterium sp. TaxID=1917865 RepID=UPI0027316F9D|nr:hypothetical protein [Sediminibacterium sp.]MDP2422132.1 hypothetical protein [Sediminibacterium sp.]
MKKYFTLFLVLLITTIGCNKHDQELEKSKSKEDFQSTALLWTIANSHPSFKSQLSITKSKLVYLNNQPVSILFFLESDNKKEFILTSNKKGKWVSNKISINEFADGGKSIIVSNLNNEIVSKYLLNNDNAIRNTEANNVIANKNTSTLPTVTVYGYRVLSNTYSTFISLYWLHGSNSDFENNYIGQVENMQLDESAGGGSIEVIEVEADDSESKDSVNARKMVDCFEIIPNNGATYSVKINADIPVNSAPNLLFNLNGFNPGHVFITLTKRGINGQEIHQSIGFYPEKGLKSIIDPNDFVKGKIVNDGLLGSEHEYNASYTVSATSEQFSTITNRLKNISSLDYSLANGNCAHFAISLFNEADPNFSSQAITYPFGGQLKYLTATPLGVYNTLQIYKNNNTPNVEIGVVKKSLTSKGPCN